MRTLEILVMIDILKSIRKWASPNENSKTWGPLWRSWAPLREETSIPQGQTVVSSNLSERKDKGSRCLLKHRGPHVLAWAPTHSLLMATLANSVRFSNRLHPNWSAGRQTSSLTTQSSICVSGAATKRQIGQQEKTLSSPLNPLLSNVWLCMW